MPELAFALAAPSDEARLEQAEAEVRGFCGWHIAPSRTETVTVEGDGGAVLLLPSLHVTAVSEILDEDGDAVTDFKWRRSGVLRGGVRWAAGREYKVTFTHGHPAVPRDVEAAVQAIASMDPVRGILRSAGPFHYEPRQDALSSTLHRYRLPPRP